MAIGTVFALSFVAALSGALMPGPLLTVTIAETARRGFWVSGLLILGHALLELLLVVGLVLGLGHFLKIRLVIGTVTVLGGMMLLWMGWGMIRDARRGLLDLKTSLTDGGTPAKSGVLRNPVVTGMVVSISNPYWLIWWATVGVTFFAVLSQNAMTTIGAFYIGHISGDILWYLAVGAAVASGRRLINPGVYRIIVQVCGSFLILLGSSFLYLLASGQLWTISMSLDWLAR